MPIEPRVRTNMAAHGFVLAPPCYRARSLWWVDIVFCRAERVGSRPSVASGLRIGEIVSFSREGAGRIYEVSGWQPADAERTWAEGAAATLVLKPEAASGPLALDFQVAEVAGSSWPESEVEVSVPGILDSSWTFRQDESWVLRVVCVPDATKLQDGVMTIAFRGPEPHSPNDAGLDSNARSLSFALRTMELRHARPGECGG